MAPTRISSVWERPSASQGGIGALLLLLVICLWDYVPPLSPAQAFEAIFAQGEAGRYEPLIVTGRAGTGDFLFIRYESPEIIVFGYCRWGHRGFFSAPFRIEPGRRYHLEVELPSLAEVRGYLNRSPGLVRLRVDGRDMLRGESVRSVRKPTEVWFGENPNGTFCEPQFHGQLLREDGRPLSKRVSDDFLTLRQRAAGWLHYAWWQALAVLLASGAVAYGWDRVPVEAGLRRLGKTLRRLLTAVRNRWPVGIRRKMAAGIQNRVLPAILPPLRRAQAPMTCMIFFTCGLFAALVLHYLLYRLSLPMKPFIYAFF